MTIFQETLKTHDYVLMEGAIIDALKRFYGIELDPVLENAALIYYEEGSSALSKLYGGYIDVAFKADVPILVCTPTWRANAQRMAQVREKRDVNGDGVKFLKALKGKWERWSENIMIGGLIGCKNDCYRADQSLLREEARTFHAWQIDRLSRAGIDFLMAATLPALSEASGMALAMEKTGLPYIISFVIDKTGLILDGNTLEHAFSAIDDICKTPPVGYMVNCAYPAFLNGSFQSRQVLSRLIGYQANASSLDHEQLDGAESLKMDDISDWGDGMIELNRRFGIKILGGCCGTGVDHLSYITEHF